MPAAKALSESTTTSSARRLSTLLEVSQALSGTLNLKAAMQRVLGTLIRHHSVVRGMVTLLRDGELHVEAAEGFEDRARNGADQGRRGDHRPGGRERQADRRAAGQPGAGVPQPAPRRPEHLQAGAQLHLRADHAATGSRWARSASTCASSRSATTTAA